MHQPTTDAALTEPPLHSGAAGPPGGPAGASPASPPGGEAGEAAKRRGLRRMKVIATGFLLLATAVLIGARAAESAGAGAWAEYVQAAAEAGMVGALADWFAVTALFRHPLGLPIPHTSIIPSRKDAIGRSLGDFVGANFLSEEVVRKRLRGIGIAARLGHWLSAPSHAARATAEVSTAVRGALTVLRDEQIQAVVGEAITRRATTTRVAEPLGELLDRIVAGGGHRGLVDLVCRRAHDWLAEHGDRVATAVTEGSPRWSPKFVDRKVGTRVYRELLRFVTDVRDDPAHPARDAIDTFLTDFAEKLRSDPETIVRLERLKVQIISRPEVQDLISSAWGAIRGMVVDSAEDENSELRRRVRAGVGSLGRRLERDEGMRGKVDGWLEDAAAYLVSTYRAEITSLITDTVAGWDAAETSRKIEIQVGRDLQFIRINGTVVGALAGLVIHAVVELV